MQTIQLTITTDVGLHARPAALFCQEAGKFKSKITLRNLTSMSSWVNGKSILGVLTLGVQKDHAIEVQADGTDEIEAVAALSRLVTANFDEA